MHFPLRFRCLTDKYRRHLRAPCKAISGLWQTTKTEREVHTSRSYSVLSENKWPILDCSISKRIDPQFTTEEIR